MDPSLTCTKSEAPPRAVDPLRITANLLGVVDVALRAMTALVKYARDTKNASSDR